MGVPNVRRQRLTQASGGQGGGSRFPTRPSFTRGGAGGSSPYLNTSNSALSPAEILAANREIADARTTAAQEQKPDDKAAAALVRLLRSPDKKAQEQGVQALTKNYDIITPETAKKYGLDDAIASVKGAKEAKDEGNSDPWYQGALGTAGKVLEVVGRPQQALSELIQAGLVDAGAINDRSNGLSDAATPELRAYAAEQRKKGGYKDAWRALSGDVRSDATRLADTRYMDYASTLGVDSREFSQSSNTAAKTIGNIGNFVGGAAIDPLNFVGGPGKSSASKGSTAAARTVARDLAAEGAEALTPRLARQLGVQGTEELSEEAIQQALMRVGARRGLTREQMAATRQLLVDEAPGQLTTKRLLSGVERTVELKGDRGVQGAVRKALGREARTGAERAADKTLSTLTRFDRGGLRVGQRSVVPEFVRAPLRKALRDDLTFTAPRVLREGLVRQAGEKATEYEARALRQSDFELRALARAEMIREKGQRLPFAKLQDEIDNVSVGLDELRATAPDGRILPEMLDDETLSSLQNTAAELRKNAKGAAKAAEGEELVTPEAIRLVERADEFDRLLAAQDYDGIKGLLDELTPAPGSDLPLWNHLPMIRTRNLEKGAKDTVRSLESTAKGAAKDYGKVVENRETLLETLRERAAEIGGPEGIPLKRKAQKALDSNTAKAGAYAERSTDFKERAAALFTASNDGDIAKLIELDPSLGDALASVRQVSNPKNLSGRLARSSVGEKLKIGFKNRTLAAGSTSLPAGTADKVYQLSTQARSGASQSANQLIREVGEVAQKAGRLSDDELTVLRDAMETPGAVPVVAGELRAAGDEAKAALLETLDKVRTQDYDTLVDSGLASALKLQSPDEYLPHVYTKEGRKAIGVADKTGQQSGSPFVRATGATAAGRQGGALEARTVTKGMTISEAEQALGAPLKADNVLKDGKALLEQDLRELVVRRGMQVRKAKESADFIDKLSTDVKDVLGGNLVQRIKPGTAPAELRTAERAARARGLERIDLGESGTAFAHPDLAPEIRNVMSLVSDDEAMQGLAKVFDEWNRIWKSYATVPLVGGVSFHSRNFLGNVANNYLAGVRDMRYYWEAGTLQKAVRSARKASPELSIPEALAKAGVAENKIAKVEAALERGVIDEGFFATDLGQEARKAIVPQSGRRKVANALNPASSDNLLVRTGTGVGQVIEDNARMAHFLSKVDELADLDAAAQSVKKYLFDYGDLTKFERKFGKRANAFYTFTRKNTPLQIAELARNPVRFNRMSMLEDAVLGSEDPEGARGPDYLRRSGGKYLGGGVASLAGTKNPIIGGIDLPVSAALETLDPAVQAAALVPLLRDIVPEDAKDKDPSAAAARGLFGLTSGGPIEAGKALAEEATGTSLFTGAGIKTDGKRKVHPAMRLSSLIAPLATKTEKTWNLSGNSQDSARLRLLKALTGITAKEITPDVTEREIKGQVYDLQQALASLKKTGVDVPTIEELRRAKIIPTPERRKRKGN